MTPKDKNKTVISFRVDCEVKNVLDNYRLEVIKRLKKSGLVLTLQSVPMATIVTDLLKEGLKAKGFDVNFEDENQ